VINVVAKIDDGLRHLRNFAKLRRNPDLVKQIYEWLGNTGNEKKPINPVLSGDNTEIILRF
jgi:hypothetical protein